jgi:hypothetical protein
MFASLDVSHGRLICGWAGWLEKEFGRPAPCGAHAMTDEWLAIFKVLWTDPAYHGTYYRFRHPVLAKPVQQPSSPSGWAAIRGAPCGGRPRMAIAGIRPARPPLSWPSSSLCASTRTGWARPGCLHHLSNAAHFTDLGVPNVPGWRHGARHDARRPGYVAARWALTNCLRLPRTVDNQMRVWSTSPTGVTHRHHSALSARVRQDTRPAAGGEGHQGDRLS